MIIGLEQYPKYQDSGVEWLGRVPAAWSVQRLGSALESITAGTWGDDPDGSNDLVCIRVADFDRDAGRVRLDRPTLRSIGSFDRARRMLRPGDLLLEKSGGGDRQPVGAVVLYAHEAQAVCSNFIARLRVAADHVPQYHAYLHSALYRRGLNVPWIKQTTGIQNLDIRAYFAQRVAFPPAAEQATIVRFLKHVDSRTRRLINAKERLIELLVEERQAIIHRAVTRGLDPDVALRPSGVEWLGVIPKHWEIRRNGALFARRSETGEPSLPILEVSLRTGVRVRDLARGERKQMMDDLTKYQGAATGDLAYNTMRMWQGAVGVVPTNGLVSPAYVVARPRPGADSSFFAALFRTPAYSLEVGRYSKGIVKDRNRLYWEDFKRMPSPRPPVEEQKAIAKWIDRRTEAVSRTILMQTRQISFLREFRARLIADVITGKVDVRKAAMNLPVDGDAEESSIDQELEAAVA